MAQKKTKLTGLPRSPSTITIHKAGRSVDVSEGSEATRSKVRKTKAPTAQESAGGEFWDGT